MSIRALLFALMLLAVWSCASQPDYGVAHDPAYDFSSVHSFAFLPRKDGMIVDRITYDLIMQRMEIALENEMVVRHLQLMDGYHADVLVAYYQVVGGAGTNNRAYTACRQCVGDNDTIWGEAGPRSKDPALNQRSSDRATLVVDIVDRRSKQLVWRGQMSGVFQKKQSQEELKQKLQEMIKTLLQQYPPAVKAVTDDSDTICTECG